MSLLMGIAAIIRTKNLKFLLAKDLFILQCVQALRVMGVFYALLALPDVYAIYFSSKQLGNGMGISFPVSYQLFLFYPPLAYLILTQLLWIKKLYIKKGALIAMSLMLIVLPGRNFITLLTALMGDSPAAILSLFNGNYFARVGLSLMTAFFAGFALMVMSGKMKKVAGE